MGANAGTAAPNSAMWLPYGPGAPNNSEWMLDCDFEELNRDSAIRIRDLAFWDSHMLGKDIPAISTSPQVSYLTNKDLLLRGESEGSNLLLQRDWHRDRRYWGNCCGTGKSITSDKILVRVENRWTCPQPSVPSRRHLCTPRFRSIPPISQRPQPTTNVICS